MKISLISDSELIARSPVVEEHIFAVGGASAIDGDCVRVHLGVDARRGLRNGCEVRRIPFLLHLGSRTLYAFWAVVFALFVDRADVVHTFGLRASAFLWVARLLRGRVVLVVTLFDEMFPTRLLDVWMIRLLKRCVQEVIVTERALQNDLLLRFSLLASWIPNGVSVKRASVNDVALHSFGIRSGGYIVYSMEHVAPYLVRDALSWLEVCVQSAELASLRVAVIVRAEDAVDLPDSVVRIASPSSDIRKALFVGARAVAFSSVPQGVFLPSVLEAMSYGKAVVAPDAHRIREVMNGFGAPYVFGSAVSFREVLDAILSDQILAASLGHSARVYVEEYYRWDATALLVRELYHHHCLFRQGIFVLR